MNFRLLLLVIILTLQTANASTPTLTNNYGPKWIFEIDQKRCLSFLSPPTKVAQSCMNLKNTDKLIFGYAKMFFSSLYINPNPSRVLLIGLGGGSVPKALVKIIPNIKIDIVEIDPDIVVLAEKYFLFKVSENIKVFIEDGFEFVKRADSKKYDIVFIDAFTEDYIPPSFLTKKFVDNIARILTDDGLVAVNTFGEKYNKFYAQESQLYEQEFRNIIHLQHGNRVILASKTSFPRITEINENASNLEEKFAEIDIRKDWLLKLLGIIDRKIFWLLKPKEAIFESN